ncbi:amino acid permease 6-like isoform X2 [Salvia splendens]|uniref:amino acid permease 6-like isoform X2 n=1 Tax=Salvia splendens TaxID=180675 RepID=UPI001C25412D|nr:amino acid permease 6-like isoform X2 [Salvia splendens]
MAKELEKNSLHIEPSTVALENGEASKDFDDDGRSRRTGTVLTASAHIITAVIGSGVLSLAWAIAQLGWVAGPAVLVAFSFITYLTSTFLADSYRHQGRRNYTYMDVVRSHLGGYKVQLCGVAQYGNLIGVTIGYTITASISMVAVKRSNCFHKEGHEAACSISTYPFMAIFGGIQLVLSQIPNFHELSWLSIVAAVMSFAYSSIGFALSVAKLAGGGGHVETGLTGTRVGVDTSASEKVWKSFQAIGDIAFAYAFSTILIEIQDTLKSPPPENVAMKKASLVGVSTTTLFYVLCGCLGYAAFGNDAPGNFLTGFGFYEPFWLIDFANVCIAIHLIGAYQAAQKKLLHRLLKITTISIFGVRAASVRLCGGPVQAEVAGKQGHRGRTCRPCSPVRGLQLQRIQISVEISVCDNNITDCNDLPLLQQLSRPHRGIRVLPADRVLPHRDAHCPGQSAQVLLQMGVAEDPQLGLPDRVPRRGSRIRTGAGCRRQDIQAFPE